MADTGSCAVVPVREVFAIYDKFLLESAASAAGSVVSCPACGDYSEFQPKTDTDAYPLQPVQLFRCIKCLQVTEPLLPVWLSSLGSYTVWQQRQKCA